MPEKDDYYVEIEGEDFTEEKEVDEDEQSERIEANVIERRASGD